MIGSLFCSDSLLNQFHAHARSVITAVVTTMNNKHLFVKVRLVWDCNDSLHGVISLSKCIRSIKQSNYIVLLAAETTLNFMITSLIYLTITISLSLLKRIRFCRTVDSFHAQTNETNMRVTNRRNPEKYRKYKKTN